MTILYENGKEYERVNGMVYNIPIDRPANITISVNAQYID